MSDKKWIEDREVDWDVKCVCRLKIEKWTGTKCVRENIEKRSGLGR